MHVLLLETIENESFELLKNEKDIQLHLAWEGMPAADILEGIDALILGCTHYVLIKDEINTFYDHKVKLLKRKI